MVFMKARKAGMTKHFVVPVFYRWGCTGVGMVPLARKPHPLGVRRNGDGPVGPEATIVGSATEWRWSRWPGGHNCWECDGMAMVPLARRPHLLGVRRNGDGPVGPEATSVGSAMG